MRRAEKEKIFERKIRKEVREKIREKDKAAYESTTLEQRRVFISLIYEGVPLGEAREQVGISFDAAMEVLKRNIKRTQNVSLNRPWDVK